MKPYALITFMASLVAALVTGATASEARADSCRHTDVVFYTSDTIRLATALGKAQAACTDYYLLINSPSGALRAQPIPTIRSLGPRFHAMAEIKLNAWAAYASANGWYAAGVEARRQMRILGYDDTLGDTWAVNEVGAPSGTSMGVDVLKNNGTARHDFTDFLHGLYTGDDGVDDPGLVFAADPMQVKTDLSQYEQDLESWYSDAGFWTGIGDYVRFWAQETYADARNWGVADATLAQRSAYLNDYFLHGIRLAQREDGSAAAARAFFAKAYTPLANASFRYAPPPTAVIAFGYTDIGVPGMLSFISAQTYALRSSAGSRFGLAVIPSNASNPLPATATETIAVEDRVAAAIHDSAIEPAGACNAIGESCDGIVAGAAFNDAWKIFANTREGSPVEVQVAAGVSVGYPTVTARGSTWADVAPPNAAAPPRFQLRPGELAYDLQTTAAFAGPVEVCVGYDPELYAGYVPRLFRLATDGWNDVTTSTDASAVCARTDGLGTFAIFAADPTPPEIAPHIEGTLGNNGWYTDDVKVTWSVTDAQSPSSIATSGCDPTFITTDSSGTTLTCIATSDGGPASRSVTVKRDATPPTIKVPAAVSAEATSAAGAAVVYSVTVVDLDPSPIWTCSPTSGSVVPLGSTTVACTATDAAGNTASVSFVVTVADATAPSLSLPTSFAVDATSPGGAVVSYAAAAVDAVDPAPAVDCAPASSATFPIGTTTVTCTATDASGNQASGSFAVTVRDAVTQISDVVANVKALDAKQGIITSLDAKLQTVLDALSSAKAGERPSACQKLDAFTNEVQAQTGKSLTQADTDRLTAVARRIQTVIGCT
ncbi:MAG: HYR domain-containing protein [Gaiellaceae bacterium]